MGIVDKILEAQHEMRKISHEASWYISPDLEAQLMANRDVWDYLSHGSIWESLAPKTVLCGFPYQVTRNLPSGILGALCFGSGPLDLTAHHPWMILLTKESANPEDGFPC